MDGLVGRDIGSANTGLESFEIAFEEAGVKLHLEIATCADRSIVWQADLARDTDVQFQRNGVRSPSARAFRGTVLGRQLISRPFR